MKLAQAEKDRLEDKQRAVRKIKEELRIEHKALFFEPWENPHDGQTYFVYNNKYFEHCRKNQDWSICPDIFSDQKPNKEFFLSTKK